MRLIEYGKKAELVLQAEGFASMPPLAAMLVRFGVLKAIQWLLNGMHRSKAAVWATALNISPIDRCATDRAYCNIRQAIWEYSGQFA